MAVEVDLEKDEPGKMWGGADNAKDYTFLLVLPKPEYTAAAFEQNPECAAAADVLFKSPMIPDEKGRASVDLKAKAKEIKDKLKVAKTEVRAVVVASSKPDNENPERRAALLETITLRKAAQSLKLTPLVGSAGPADWFTHHHSMLFVELEAKEVPQITFETDPKTPWFQTPMMVCGVWENTAPGQIGVKSMLLGSFGQDHGPDPKCKCPTAPHGGSWWNLWATQINQKNAAITLSLKPGVERYVFGCYPRFPGQYVLTVKGTGPFAKLEARANLTFTGAHPCPGD